MEKSALEPPGIFFPLWKMPRSIIWVYRYAYTIIGKTKFYRHLYTTLRCNMNFYCAVQQYVCMYGLTCTCMHVCACTTCIYPLVQSLASCMGGTLLSLICREFALSYGSSCGGLPDLTLWNPSSAVCKVRQTLWYIQVCYEITLYTVC